MSSPSVAQGSASLTAAARARTRRPWRWLAALAVVSVLHWIAAQWVEHNRDTFVSPETQRVPVQVQLLKPERVEQTPAGSTAKRAAPVAQARAQATQRRRSEHVLTATRPQSAQPARRTAPAAEKAPETAAASEAASFPAAASASAAGTDTNAGAASGAAATGAQGTGAVASSGVKFSVPPSGDLQYDTFYNGVRNQTGTLHWTSDGQHYEMVIAVPLPFVGTFRWTSHGHVDAFGLAPDQYIEQRGRRPEDVTVFNREQKQIVFTRTPNSLALPDGAQDRFSMVMQLASLVRGDPDAYKPGVTREFYVADNDSGETWPIETIGDETIRTAQGFVTARHFMRLPRHEGDRRRIDVWLAPSLGWLPARLMQTEPNGTEIELVWHGNAKAPPVETTPTGGAGSAADTPAGASVEPGDAGASSGSAAGQPQPAAGQPAATQNALPSGPAQATQPGPTASPSPTSPGTTSGGEKP
ncbi:DUF3108 domain-containing protein [Paraburkholderia kururiensis]|uniref:DUF3108 domain-containing protein n=1 Tax=Paraburkholderia kururiensis TaxID=984307 RepID=UPI0005A9A733|nr:DUF3108 domain-containing protein [Paraburkholderia kururiensis]